MFLSAAFAPMGVSSCFDVLMNVATDKFVVISQDVEEELVDEVAMYEEAIVKNIHKTQQVHLPEEVDDLQFIAAQAAEFENLAPIEPIQIGYTPEMLALHMDIDKVDKVHLTPYKFPMF